jgi:hypothetical protein
MEMTEPPDTVEPPDARARAAEALRAGSGEAAPVVPSLVLLILDVAAYGGLVVHTLLSRRRYRPLLSEVRPTAATDLFLSTPGAVYAAMFLLFVVLLLLKECLIERKDVTLRLNLVALVGAIVLFAVFLWQIQIPFEKLRS